MTHTSENETVLPVDTGESNDTATPVSKYETAVADWVEAQALAANIERRYLDERNISAVAEAQWRRKIHVARENETEALKRLELAREQLEDDSSIAEPLATPDSD